MRNKILIVIFIILSLFIITACGNDTKKEEKEVIAKEETEKNTYLNYVKKLKKITKTTEDLPFTVEVLYEKIESEVRYQVIIDNPKEEIKDVMALAIHNKQTDDVFPSVGIFDDKVDLIPDKKPSGVILVGYIPYTDKMEDFKVEMKVLISYTINDKKYTSYYLTKK